MRTSASQGSAMVWTTADLVIVCSLDSTTQGLVKHKHLSPYVPGQMIEGRRGWQHAEAGDNGQSARGENVEAAAGNIGIMENLDPECGTIESLKNRMLHAALIAGDGGFLCLATCRWKGNSARPISGRHNDVSGANQADAGDSRCEGGRPIAGRASTGDGGSRPRARPPPRL